MKTVEYIKTLALKTTNLCKKFTLYNHPHVTLRKAAQLGLPLIAVYVLYF
ncbi:MAG: hypothetical protein N3A69_04150 [Leptospiraceae bacterium]|nr:hypothetical protein [Leptospiraceae bacterium]